MEPFKLPPIYEAIANSPAVQLQKKMQAFQPPHTGISHAEMQMAKLANAAVAPYAHLNDEPIAEVLDLNKARMDYLSDRLSKSIEQSLGNNAPMAIPEKNSDKANIIIGVVAILVSIVLAVIGWLL